MKIKLLLIILLLIPTTAFTAFENLDELIDVRAARRSVNTYYSGASSGNNWFRQPEILVYTDIIAGNEVSVLSNTAEKSNIYYTDISPANPWSGDGSYLAFFSNREVEAFNRYTGSTLDGQRASTFVVRTDGSKMRVTHDASNRTYGSSGQNYFWWNPSLPTTYYTTGGWVNGLSLDRNGIYANVVAENSISYSKILDVYPTDDSTDFSIMKKIISPDGTTIVGQTEGYPDTLFWPMTIYPHASATLLDPDGWLEQRGQTDEWAGGDPFACKHDVYMPSSDFFIPLFSQDCNSVTPVMYKYNVTGTDTDGGPLFDNDETTYASFNDFETEPLITYAPTNVPWKLEKDTHPNSHGWGHPGFGRWGRVVVYNDSQAYHELGGVLAWGGPVAWDYINRDTVANPAETQPTVLIQTLGTYIDWNAWSDYFAYAANNTSGTDDERKIWAAEYNVLAVNGNDTRLVAYHHGDRSTGNYQYTSNARVAQSPDGTKISYAITFLTDNILSGDLAYAVAYYPHPPEIIATAAGVVRFDWRTDQVGSRGYTQRGWPDESTNDPPPPRETEKFRLWKQVSCSGDWAPVTTVNADIFSMYDFSDGTWAGNKYWDITDPNPSGSDCYSVSAVEWSGLESQVKSNIFSDVTDSQTVAYPADPKAATGITSSYDEDILRYYNIYADDGATPTITQTMRVASIPIASGTDYVDWLGKTDGTTQYVVTAVDTQGNESDALSVSATHKQSPATADGQYTLSWGGSTTNIGTGTTWNVGTGTAVNIQ